MEPETIITPIIANQFREDNKNDIADKSELSINLNIPDNPNFDNDPARYKDIDELTSQWTSGGR